MSVRARVANWPLAWKAPLLAAGLLIGVAFVISQIVLNRLESDQENNLRHLTSAYLDGLSTAVLRSAIHADVWETFDALDRALRCRILEERERGYAFRHPVVGAAVYDGLPRHRRDELHAALAATGDKSAAGRSSGRRLEERWK